MSGRHKELFAPSFIGGFIAGSLVWSLGWAGRRARESRLKLNSNRDVDDSSDGDDENMVPDFPDRSEKSVRWPWDKLRKTLSFRYPSFLKLELDCESDALVTKTGPCIGEIFGMDVGGTLTKLVYFEPIREDKTERTHEELHLHATNTTDTLHNTDSQQGLCDVRQTSVPDRLNEFAASVSFDESLLPGQVESGGFNGHVDQYEQPNQPQCGGMKKSRSMINLSKSTEHAEALENFYSYARRLDIHGTAVKDKHLSYFSEFLNGTFHFIRFETRRMDYAISLIRYSDFHRNIKEIGATGGGAHKFANDWNKELGINMAKQDEMDTLVAGMQFVMADIKGECYTFLPESRVPSMSFNNRNNQFEDTEAKSSLAREDSSTSESNKPDQWWTSKKVQRDNVTSGIRYPYLLVSIGTGVSILRVDGPRKQERISGSTIGGGTYWGLCRLLTGSDSFSDVLDLAMKGDPSKVDMMVGDIYGKNSNALEKLGLPSDVVASSFGKLVTKQNPSEGIKEEDLARALLLMVTNNIGQVAHLNAKLYKTSRIYFIGTFLQHNVISQQRLAYSIDYWSQGKMEAQFLEHEGYFGALGAFLLNGGIEHDDNALHSGIIKDENLEQQKRPIKKSLHKRQKSLSIGSHSSLW